MPLLTSNLTSNLIINLILILNLILNLILFLTTLQISGGYARPLTAREKVMTVQDVIRQYFTPGELLEGDIRLPLTFWRRNAIANPSKRWPGGVVPYEVSPSFSQGDLDHIHDAFREISAASCVTFRERAEGDPNHLRIEMWDECSSSIGMDGGGQYMSLASDCMGRGQIIHELMHTLGFWHEQSREDRTDYIDINTGNIIITEIRNFALYPSPVATTLGEPYDYDSVMHYGPYEYAVDPSVPTITTTNPQDMSRIGQRVGLSQLDIVKLNKYYQCQWKGWQD